MPDLHKSGRKTTSSLEAARRGWLDSEPTGKIITPLSEAEYMTSRFELSRDLPARFSGNWIRSCTVRLSASTIINTGSGAGNFRSGTPGGVTGVVPGVTAP